VELWRKALEMVTRRGDGASAGWSEPLTAASAGEVTELAARPGMSIEAGGLIARLVDFRRPLVRLDVSPEAMVGAPPPEVELFTAASGVEAPDRPDGSAQGPAVRATLVGPAPQVDVASQFASYWYEASLAPEPGGRGDSAGWRPGLFVQAYLPVPGASAR